jgi:GPH family glycoside/pentoside/hexuronide:cation symporter
MEKKPLSKVIKTLYGLADFGFGMRVGFNAYFYIFFLSNIARFPAHLVVIITSISTAVNAVLSPVYGGIITSVKPMKWGRNRSWMLLLTPVVIVATMFQWTRISSNDLVCVAVIIITFVIGAISSNIVWVANLNLIPTLANNPAEQGMLSSHRMMYSSASSMAIGYIGTPLIAFFTARLGSQFIGYPATMLAMCVIYSATHLVVFMITKGYEPTGTEEAVTTDKQKEKVGVGTLIKSVTQNSHLIFLLCGDFFQWMSNFMYMAVIAFYFTYVAKNMSLMAHYLFISSVGSFVGASLAGPLSKKFSNRNLALVGFTIAGGFMILGKITGLSIVWFFVCGIVSRLAVGAVSSWVVPMYSEAGIYSEWKTGRNASAFIMGTMNLSLQAANVTRNVAIPLILAAVGFVAGLPAEQATPATQQGILTLMMLIPGIMYLITVVFLGLGYRLNSEKLAQYQKEIAERKAVAEAQAAATKS